MKLSESFFLTRREDPNDEFNEVSKLLVKSGMVIKNDNGIYSYLPIGLKVIKNIEDIIRQEFKKINCKELLLPILVKDDNEAEITFEEEYHLIDRNENQMKLTHTSVDLFCDLVRHKVRSYKDLHFTLFQINNKFRDEKRVEYGLVRQKEFIECEGYSFDTDEGGLDVSYDKMFLAFKNIFSSLSINPMVVRGNEGIFSEEFQVTSDCGDNIVVKCTCCGYTANIEDANSKFIFKKKDVQKKKRELVKTDENKTVKDLCMFFNVNEKNVLKSIVFKVDGIYKLALLRGSAELNVNKLMSIYDSTDVEIPTKEDLEKLDVPVNYIGPINCAMEIIADNEVKLMKNFICGSNKKYYHFKNVNVGRDFKIDKYDDIKVFDENSLCPLCKNKCEMTKGIEIGQINKIGDKLSSYYNISYTDEANQKSFIQIGSYYIGIDRCLNAIVEENHDEKGIIWPMSVAPYKVAIVVANMNHEKMCSSADKIYKKLESNGIDTLFDDRKESIGVKLNDIELIGIPIIIIIGNNIDKNIVEVKLRNKKDVKEIQLNKFYDYISNLIDKYNKK